MEGTRVTCLGSGLISYSWYALPDYSVVGQHNTFGNPTEFEGPSGLSWLGHPDDKCVSFLGSVHLQQLPDDLGVSRLRIG